MSRINYVAANNGEILLFVIGDTECVSADYIRVLFAIHVNENQSCGMSVFSVKILLELFNRNRERIFRRFVCFNADDILAITRKGQLAGVFACVVLYRLNVEFVHRA